VPAVSNACRYTAKASEEKAWRRGRNGPAKGDLLEDIADARRHKLEHVTGRHPDCVAA
jgi:hypothetical protein